MTRKKKYCLVTTADERTWPRNKPVLFLGEWCKRFSRKEKWSKLDFKTATYHWDDRAKLSRDYNYLQGLHEVLLKDLSIQLNKIHNVNYSIRYWRILIGPWLGYFVQALFDRWFMLKKAVEQPEVTNCFMLDRCFISVVPNDMKNFNELFIDDNWNEAIYSQLLEILFKSKINIKKIQLKSSNNANEIRVHQIKGGGWKKQLKKWIEKSNIFFCKDNDYFFISTYLPLKTEFKLQLGLRQLPKLWQFQSAPITKPDIQKRQWRLDNDNNYKDNSFEFIVRKLIPLHIPTLYLEGYKELVATTNVLPWPKKPRAIFTCNSYMTDDLFKAWAAEKVENRFPLIIGQHGGNFGMSTFSFHEEHQIAIADKWLSWGWKDLTRENIIPIGNLRSSGRSVKYDPDGGALLVETSLPRYSCHLLSIPISRQYLDYLEDQMLFLQELPHQLQKEVLLKLYSVNYGWDEVERWKDRMPEIKVDLGCNNIEKLINKCRIYVSTYNATTYLESLIWNVPTIIFWNPKHWELTEDVRPYFELLESVGILHKTPQGAAQQMVKVWDNVSGWWEASEVQSVREKFCYQFSRELDSTGSDLQSIFKKIKPI